MDFKTASVIAKEQNLFITTEYFYNIAAADAKKIPGMVVHLAAYRFVNGTWRMGNKELPESAKSSYTWRVCARETLTYNGHYVQ